MRLSLIKGGLKMQYRKFGKLNIETSALGFGCMRLPLLKDGSDNIDETLAISLIRDSIDKGVNYIDTAYPYHGGKSELLVSKALKDGYREKVYLADKCPVWLVKVYEDFDRLLNEQLEKLQTDHIDFYLMHSLNADSWKNIKSLDYIKFIEKAKKDGRIKHIGFSFHDELKIFKDIVDSYEWDFCQIQYNFMDQKNQAGTEGLYYAAAKNMAIVVMEPLLGGKLANEAPSTIQALWDTAKVKRTPVGWALSWIWNHPQVSIILSGMNAQKQLDENLAIAEKALPNSLSKKENDLVDKVKNQYAELTKVPCTACEYCMPCPSGVDIPGIFKLYNQSSIYNDLEGSLNGYKNGIDDQKKADNCVECGDCESVCPQKIQIIEKLKEAHKVLSK